MLTSALAMSGSTPTRKDSMVASASPIVFGGIETQDYLDKQAVTDTP